MKRIIILMGILSVLSLDAYSQLTHYILDGTTNGTTVKTCHGYFYDSGHHGFYSSDEDYTITFERDATVRTMTIAVKFDTFDIASTDRLYIHDGPDVSSPPLLVRGLPYVNNSNPLRDTTIMPSCDNITGCLTFRFESSSASSTAEGWRGILECKSICEGFTVRFDTTYHKVVGTDKLPYKMQLGLTENIIDSTGAVTDTIEYNTLDLCDGDSIVVKVSTDYDLTQGACRQDDWSSKFKWSFGDRTEDSMSGSTVGHSYKDVMGYDLTVAVTDANGCLARAETRVRVAPNPIKRMGTFPDMCTGTDFTIHIGYAGSSMIVLDSIERVQPAKESFTDTVFIPDGPTMKSRCPGMGNCFTPSVTFDQYPPGMTILSGGDICAVCIDMNHTFAGDLGFYLVCPTGQKSTLMTYLGSGCTNYTSNPDLPILPPGTTCNNSGAQMGVPGGPRSTTTCDGSDVPYGDGWQYCWSNKYLNNTQGQMGPHTRGGGTIDSTDYEGKNKFFIPDSSFNNLIGCPLNGEWTIEICDYWGSDIGWTFGVSVEFCDINPTSWDYQVDIDTTIWEGPFLHDFTTRSVVITPERGGTFEYKMTLIDEFGCEWDSTALLNVVQVPEIKLINDTALCSGGNMSIILDSGVPDTNAYPNTYLWEPTGDSTSTIEVTSALLYPTMYKVQVTSRNENINCWNVDSVLISILPTPTPSFYPDKSPIEGCQPLEVTFTSTTANADVYIWDFGDGNTSSETSPTHVYPNPGIYDVSLKATNSYGCEDSIHYTELIRVFSKPEAEFTWKPDYPSLIDPTVRFNNETVPLSDENIYAWHIQDNLKDPLSYTYIFDSVHPYYTFPTDKGAEVTGDYVVRLIASTKNYPPSGYVYECKDTVSHTITLINDFLQFPNVVTANGDGINDVFRVTNIMNRTAFPNNELYIYNRQGRMVYHKKNITESDFWDPNADKMSSGTYFYKFVVKGYYKDAEFNGTIEVVVN